MKHLKVIFAAAILMAASWTFASGITVTGRVTTAESGEPIPFVSIRINGTSSGTSAGLTGAYTIAVPSENSELVFSAVGYKTTSIKVGKQRVINVAMKQSAEMLEEIILMDEVEISESEIFGVVSGTRVSKRRRGARANYNQSPWGWEPVPHNTEEYDVINENIFVDPLHQPLSTFSIDVDAASYSNMRRMINNGNLPHRDAVRIEEMINYFTYDYPNPDGDAPFSIFTEVSQAPWNAKHKLVHIGLQGRKPDYENLGSTNLVFLIDVSGSMSSPNKLALLKSSMKMLVNELRPADRVAIVVYAGAAGLVLPSTPASEKTRIMEALDRLEAGGSTAGGAGIKLAYKVARENLIEGGNNRVILATDGDFNVGASSTAEMVRLIEKEREAGIFLTIAGFGMGNYKDGRMEQISNAGNGNYYYIDNIGEAKKVFVTEMRATLFTIAKDVKIQIEFNPDKVQAYRLIGYENRMLRSEDFNDDKKDAGELGAGHTVTALYEIIPVGVESEFVKDVDTLKYQNTKRTPVSNSDELLTVKFRYKDPDGSKSKLIVRVVKNVETALMKTSDNFRFSAAVAELGMLLRDSEFKSVSSYDNVLNLAAGSKGKDAEGYRQEFIRLAGNCKMLAENLVEYDGR